MFAGALLVGLAAAGAALVGLVLPRLRAGSVAVLLGAFALGAASAAVPLDYVVRVKTLPYINDITTDTEHPPQFSPPKTYESYFGELQQIGYPDLHPLELALPPKEAFARAAEIARNGGLIVYPTDSCYALGCHIGDKEALDRIRRIRAADRHHHFTLVCRDLAEIGRYARVETWQFRMLKAATPGPYTFLLPATRETPRRLQHEKRRTIGIRVPDHPVPRLLLAELGEPLMSSTLLLPGDELPLTDGREIRNRLEHQVDCVLDGGHCGIEPTTVVDLAVTPPTVTRIGRGSLEKLGL